MATSVVAILALGASIAGCHKTWTTSTTQPPLQIGSTQEARTAFPQAIFTRDMELPHSMWLSNRAYFVVVSKDRLRFHVTLEHKWKSMSDPERWRVWIEDEYGRHYDPESIDRNVLEPVTEMYEYGTKSSVNDLPLFAVTIWRGYGDYSFHRRDLFRSDMRELTLVMKRPGYEYRYTWSFVAMSDADDAIAGKSSPVVVGLRH